MQEHDQIQNAGEQLCTGQDRLCGLRRNQTSKAFQNLQSIYLASSLHNNSQTFWCNVDVFRCCQAALAIAKRGLNVDRCFIGISPGGVGQSLYSLHLSEMYKHNHVYFDPNIWYLDEELRKQVETFARAFIMTGQEAPESSKKLHIDLYKKTISADGIMGRKPYGYSTKMFHTIGWTRLEVNRIMKFLGVGNNAFNSTFRRSLVWKAKARFIHKKFLAAYEDHEKDGIFEADPSLNKFLATSQASIAGLRLQWAFERDNNKEDCYQLIENYCNGGDSYLTEDVMRNACGLPVRQQCIHMRQEAFSGSSFSSMPFFGFLFLDSVVDAEAASCFLHLACSLAKTILRHSIQGQSNNKGTAQVSIPTATEDTIHRKGSASHHSKQGCASAGSPPSWNSQPCLNSHTSGHLLQLARQARSQ